jgi:hypothetical protein
VSLPARTAARTARTPPPAPTCLCCIIVGPAPVATGSFENMYLFSKEPINDKYDTDQLEYMGHAGNESKQLLNDNRITSRRSG